MWRAFGRFQRLLRDYPAETLHETIPRFHDTENRLQNLKNAVAADPLGRARTQCKLVADMEEHWDELNAIVEKYIPNR